MPASKIGRNDPCPCGSGKKYKHCHMLQDQLQVERIPGERYKRGDQGSVATQIKVLQKQARAALRAAPPGAVPAIQSAIEAAEELIAYEQARERMDAAITVLEAHRETFQALLRDSAAAVERAQRLFGEDRFRAFRFRAEDVARAFEAVGYPQRVGVTDEHNDRVTEAATLYLAAENDYRAPMTRRLMMMLPEFVNARRYLDAWLLQYSAFLMRDHPKRSNPFLGIMFDYGFEDWARQVDEAGETVLRAMGLDPDDVRHMSPDEALARLQAQMENPAGKARLERYYAEHPLLNEQAQAELTHLHRSALTLLERSDAQAIRLAPEETHSWLSTLMERVAPLNEELRRTLERGDPESKELRDQAAEVFWGVATEMAQAIFTRARLDRLVHALVDYRSALMLAHESEAVLFANGAMLTLQHEDAGPDDPFLVGLCYIGLRDALSAASEQAEAEVKTESSDADTGS